MNDIDQRQNEELQIQRLAAQRELYKKAKRLMLWQFVVLGSGTLLVSATVIIDGFQMWGVIWGLLGIIANHRYFQPLQERLREEAAVIQEAFDCDVLRLDWPKELIDKKPDAETVAGAAHDHFRRGNKRDDFFNWYSGGVGEVPLHIGRIICQRQNSWWDAKLREAYGDLLIYSMLFLIVLVFVIGMLLSWSVVGLVSYGLVPLVPLLDLFLGEARAQQRAARQAERIKGRFERIWADALAGQSTDQCSAESRELQDAIFEHRASAPLVPDIFYELLRSRMNEDMNLGARRMVEDAKSAGITSSR